MPAKGQIEATEDGATSGLAVGAGFGEAEDALWRKQQAVIRRARNQGKGFLGGKLNHKCRCACGLRFTTKGIHQHQRRCAAQLSAWGKPLPPNASDEPRTQREKP